MNNLLEFFGISVLSDYPYLFFILQGALLIIVLTELLGFVRSLIKDILRIGDR